MQTINEITPKIMNITPIPNSCIIISEVSAKNRLKIFNVKTMYFRSFRISEQ